MAMYTFPQLQQLWIQAGGNPQAAPTAAAIAMAESGGNSTILGDTTITGGGWGPSVGLWQIRSLVNQNHTGGVRDQYADADAMANARAAISVSNNGQNWQPWSTFTSGSYLHFLNGGGPSTGPLPNGSAPGGGGGMTPAGFNPLAGDDWLHVVDVLGNYFVYAGMIALGALLMAIGFVLVFEASPAGASVGNVVSTAKRVTPFL